MRAMFAILLPLGACTVPAAVAEEMREGLTRVNEALAVSLIALEPPSYAVDPLASGEHDFRHPAGGPCPSNERDVDDPDTWTRAELDYGAGCVPRSGLLPTLAAGSTVLDRDPDAVALSYDGLWIALRNQIEGDFHGVADGDLQRREVQGSAALRIEGREETLEAELVLRAILTPSTLTLDAEVELPLGRVVLSDVHLPLTEIRGECPTPADGMAVVDGSRHPIEVHLGAPGTGEVTVTRGRRSSDPTPLCGYAAWLLRG